MIFDKLINLVTGMGGARDKNTGNAFVTQFIGRAELTALYRSDWLARKIVDCVPFDMCREGRHWQAEVGTEITPLEKLEEKLQVWQKLCRAMQWARLYGEAYIYMSIKGSPSSKLDPLSVQKDALQYIHVFTDQDLTKGPIVTDPLSEDFGKAEYYEVSGGDTGKAPVRIHPSRIIAFQGSPVPDNSGTSIRADSVLQIIYEAVMNVASANQNIASMLPEAKLDVIRVPHLSDFLSTEAGTAKVRNRFANAKAVQSMYNVLLLEGDGESGEVWEQKQINFAAFPDLMRAFLEIASGAADIPATRLLGTSPKGMNATGDSDIRNYYDMLAARQQFDLAPAIATLDDVLILSALGSRPAEIYYEFAPLWQMSDKEKADAAYVRAQATQIYANSGLIPSEVLEHGLKNQLIEEGTYPGIEQAYQDFEDGNLEPLDPEAAALEEEQQQIALEGSRKALNAPPASPKGPKFPVA